jgi:proteasome assembly chaperone (PAC2) family protein
MLANTGTAKETRSPRAILLAITNTEGLTVHMGELGRRKKQIHHAIKAVKKVSRSISRELIES